MRLCLMVEGQENVTWPEWVALADAVEASGLEGLYRSDHYLSGAGRVGSGALDSWATLAGLAHQTRRIRLGTTVSPVSFRHPSVLASMVTTVDHISGGRVELGLGAGWYRLEHDAFGFAFPPVGTRMAMLEEQIEIIHRQWTEDEVSFSGRYYSLDRCPALPKPLQQPPPIIVGGSARPRTVRAAVRYGAEYNYNVPQPGPCRDARSVLDQECERQGRDPSSLRLSVMAMNTVVGANSTDLSQKVDRVLQVLGPETPDGHVSRDPGAWFAGTADEIVERLAELGQAGADRVLLQHLAHRDLESIALIGEEILPHVAGL
jgi:F420-dependent oxidoreductase-like protein